MNIIKTFLVGTYLLCMLAMISDYKVLCNFIGSFTTIIVLVYLYFHKGKIIQQLERKTTLYVFFFFFYFTITSFFHFEPQQWGITLIVYLIVFTPFFLFNHLENKKEKTMMKILVVGFFVIWTVFLIICYVTCLLIPDLARMMAADRPSFSFMINGGGYYMGNGAAILITYLYNRILRGEMHGFFKKLFAIFEIILMIATILVINSFVILVSMIVGMTIVTINNSIKLQHSKVVVYFLLGISFFFIYINIASILGFVLENVENEFWHNRISETYESVVNGDNSHHVDERDYVYQISKDGFWESPILGNGYKNGNTFDSEGKNGVGNHSTILDAFAQFGVVGSVPLFLFLLYPFRRAKRNNENWEFFIPFFVMAYFNPVLKCYHVMAIMFLIIPCMEYLRKTSDSKV